jgi:hypothetical protein
LSLASTDSESVYNLAEYIHYLKEEKKAEAQGKLALFLLKPINDMTDSYGVRRPTQFVFEK